MSKPEWLRKEVFYLAYHIHWSYHEIMDLPIGERKHFVQLLTKEIERQNKELEESLKALRE
ncbi:MAG: hypothetical protein D6805_05610 [Planctomycetota bacterium]|nr:MAG: hypothetical protein D6805_05610 [Planctomycetota bacterium]